MKKKNGFTLVEILITITIIGLIALIVIPTVNNINKKALEKSKQIFYSNIKSAALSYADEFANDIKWKIDSKDGIEEANEYICIPVKFLKEKGFFKDTLQIPGENQELGGLVRIERDKVTKVIDESTVDPHNYDCQVADSKKPEINLVVKDEVGNTLDINNMSWTNKTIILAISASDENGINSIKIKYNSEQEIPYYQDKVQITIDDNINKTLNIYATDNYGNESENISFPIMIDKIVPTVDSISANKTSDMITVSATASDNLSGVVSYWYSIDGTNYYRSNDSSYTFGNVSDGNYTAYVYVKDAAGNTSSISQVDVIFDNTPPQLASLNVTSSAGTYTSGNTINIEATYSENILNGSGNTFTSTDAPVLSLKFGSGESRNATFVSHSGNKIVYQITVNSSDLGTLQINSYSGTVYDTANNQLNITTPSLGGNTVSASTKAKIDSTYYATLANAIASSGTTKTIQMVNNTAECVVIPSTNTITLDLNGKTITCNTANTSAITNNGTLTVNDTSTGGTITSTYYGIENKGSATLTNGTIKSTSNTSIYNNSTQTNASGTSLYINGASIVSTSGVGINNVSTGTVTIASGSVKGKESGIYNTTSGAINIGLNTDTLSTEIPGVYSTGGSAYGVYMNSGGTLNINNGSLYTANTSVTSAYYKGSCTLTARSDYHITSATATVDGTNYKKSYLVSGVTQIQYQYRNYDSCISRECQGGYVSNSSCGYASCENSNCSCAEWNYTTTCGSWQQGTCEKSGVNLDTTSQCNRQGTSCTAYTSCSAGGQAGSGYYCCDYTRSCSKKRTSCKTYNSCTDSSCGYDTCYDSCATMKCVGGYTSWTSWSPSTLSGYSYCQKRTCNLDAEGVVTSCGSAGSC